MIEKQTVVDQIEITRSGAVQIRIGLLLVEDGTEIDCKWHRTIVPPEVNPADQIVAVNEHLAQMNCNPVSEQDIAKIAAHVALTREAS